MVSTARSVAVLAMFLPIAAATVLADGETLAKDGPAEAEVRFFETKIRPLLSEHCNDCHGQDAQESELRLDSLRGILMGGKAGPAIVPHKPGSSLLITAVSYRDSELRMPPEKKLSDQQIADLTRWVTMGAPHPEQGSVEVSHSASGIDWESGRQHWAFQPLVALPPALGNQGEDDVVDNPIDRFLAVEINKHGLKQHAPADKRILIRRATFDLIGLPPTREEVESFLSDTSGNAFARVVERLLSSPHYGERWGRHWLDVARYADSNGLDENAAHGNAWRYRDYVVQAFNDDLPYDDFLREQLAGDLLDSGDDPQLRNRRLIATGYLSLGPKVLAEPDAAKMEMDIIGEQIDTIGRGLMGLTLGCCRCHDHKFDPIGQDEYYGLAGIFKSTRTMNNFKVVAEWHEHSIALPEDERRKKQHEDLVAAKQHEIDSVMAADVPDVRVAELKKQLETLKADAPVMPMAMGVTEGKTEDVAIHLRGSTLTLGDIVPRQFPSVLAGDQQTALPADQSGRLQFAEWLTTDNRALTARVMINRIWRWHFGKGLVSTADNFGMKGATPTHPALLDWLAQQFIENGWSVKAMHRQIMSSAAYQRGSGFDEHNAAVDSENQWYWRFEPRRLEAEAIRDTLLAVSGTLDRTMGGRLLATKNRDLVFNHESKDTSTYDIRRRSIYVPVVRNHLYDVFRIFDYTDADVLNGNRDTSTVAPQALFLMNSPFVTEVARSLAIQLQEGATSSELKIQQLFETAYGRPATAQEVVTATTFLSEFGDHSAADGSESAWQALCQAVVSSSELFYIR